VDLGRWHADWDSPADAAEHSMMWGGVASRAAARRAPRSMLEGSTLPSQSHLSEVVEEVMEAVVTVDGASLTGGET